MWSHDAWHHASLQQVKQSDTHIQESLIQVPLNYDTRCHNTHMQESLCEWFEKEGGLHLARKCSESITWQQEIDTFWSQDIIQDLGARQGGLGHVSWITLLFKSIRFPDANFPQLLVSGLIRLYARMRCNIRRLFFPKLEAIFWRWYCYAMKLHIEQLEGDDQWPGSPLHIASEQIWHCVCFVT